MPETLRRAGGRWRLLVHGWVGGTQKYGTAHHVQPTPGRDDEGSRVHVLPGTEFDELVVGSWLHVEQMDTGRWWVNVGGVTVLVDVDRDGRPRRVNVYGPGDYDDTVEGCTYGSVWSAS